MDSRIYIIMFLSIAMFLLAVLLTIIAGIPPPQAIVWNSLSSFDIIYYTLPLGFASKPLIFIASLLDVFVFALMAVWMASTFFSMIKGINLQRRRTNAKIKKLKSHIIITPFNKFADQVMKALDNTDLGYVVITDDEKSSERLEKEGILTVLNEPRSEDTFISAGIMKAKFLVVCYEDDVQNILMSMAAKSVNKDINVVSRLADIKNLPHFTLSGVYKTVAPEVASGNDLASEIMKHIT